MYDYRKEKQFIVAYDMDKNHAYAGKYDIPNHQFYGIKGAPVTNTPRAFSRAELNWMSTQNIYCLNLFTFFTELSPRQQALYAARFEELISLNFVICKQSFDNTQPPHKLTKSFCENYIKYCEEHEDFYIYEFKGITYYKYTIVAADAMLREMTIANTLSSYPRFIKHLVCAALCQDYIEENQTDKMKLWADCLTRLYEEHYITTNTEQLNWCRYDNILEVNIGSIINTWIKASEALGLPLKVPHNFVDTAFKVSYEYKLLQEKEKNKLIATINGNEKLRFENENFFVHLLPSADAMVEEGHNQHNCVGRLYIDEVIKKRSIIVSIRKKSEPDKSYITCEIQPTTGKIAQYLRTCNQNPDRLQDLEFKRQYQQYLNSIWNA